MASKLPRIPTAAGNTAKEQADARRLVHRNAASTEDKHALLNALGLNTPNGDR